MQTVCWALKLQTTPGSRVCSSSDVMAGAPEVPGVIMTFLEVPAADGESWKYRLRSDAFIHSPFCILF